jgi:YhcH/YjgK/YiaL family protein
MIITTIKNDTNDLSLTPEFNIALDFLHREGWRDHKDGIISIDGDRVYGNILSYKTKILNGPKKFESHRKYADIHYIIDGEEILYQKPVDSLVPMMPYDDKNDVLLFESACADVTPVILTVKNFVVCFPEDAHAPAYCVHEPIHVRKIVIKVAL